MNATRLRIRTEKTLAAAMGDLAELDHLVHGRRAPRYLKKVARRAERRLSKVEIHEALSLDLAAQ